MRVSWSSEILTYCNLSQPLSCNLALLLIIIVQKMEYLDDGVLKQDEQKLSNIFCKFFKTKIIDIERSIPEIDEDPIER